MLLECLIGQMTPHYNELFFPITPTVQEKFHSKSDKPLLKVIMHGRVAHLSHVPNWDSMKCSFKWQIHLYTRWDRHYTFYLGRALIYCKIILSKWWLPWLCDILIGFVAYFLALYSYCWPVSKKTNNLCVEACALVICTALGWGDQELEISGSLLDCNSTCMHCIFTNALANMNYLYFFLPNCYLYVCS